MLKKYVKCLNKIGENVDAQSLVQALCWKRNLEGVVEANFTGRLERERRVDEILESNTDALSKVQQIMRLGVDEEDAEEIVSRQQLGLGSPVYYERLDNYYD